MEHAQDALQRDVECIAACEVLQWPDRGRASNTFTHPMPCQAAKPHKPASRVWDLNSVRSILVNNTISSSSYVVMSEVAFEGFALGLEGWKKALGGCCEPGKGSEGRRP